MDIINSSSMSFKCVPRHTHTPLQQKHKTKHSKETFLKSKTIDLIPTFPSDAIY